MACKPSGKGQNKLIIYRVILGKTAHASLGLKIVKAMLVMNHNKYK